MIVLIILGIIAAMLTVIMLTPIGADISFEGGELRISAKVAGILLQIFPKSKDKPKEKKAEQPKEQLKQEKKESSSKDKRKLNLNFSFDEIMELLKTVLRSVGSLKRKVRVDRFLLDYVAAGVDPYRVTVWYAYVNAALNILAPICHERFTVKDLSVHTDIDYNITRLKLDFGLALTIRIGAIMHMINTIIVGILWTIIKKKIRLFREKRQQQNNSDLPADGAAENTDNINSDDNMQEERKNENGE